MNWDDKCVLEFTHHNMFESSQHRQRFRDLVNCYYRSPFFTKGLCKCMYLASWDEDHFLEILTVLNDLTIDGAHTTKLMSEEGAERMAEVDGFDAEMYKLSTAFLTNGYYKTPDFTALDPDEAHIIRQGLLAASLIDDMPDPN